MGLQGMTGMGGGALGGAGAGGAAAYMLEYVILGNEPGYNTQDTITIPTDYSYTTVKVAGCGGGGYGGRSIEGGGGGGGSAGNIIGDEFPIPGLSITSLYYKIGYGGDGSNPVANDAYVKINGPSGTDLIRFTAGGDGEGVNEGVGGPATGAGPSNGRAGGDGGWAWYDGKDPVPTKNGGPALACAGGGGGGGGSPGPTGPQPPHRPGAVGGYVPNTPAPEGTGAAIQSLGALSIGPAPQTWSIPQDGPGGQGWGGGSGGQGYPRPANPPGYGGSGNDGAGYAGGGESQWGGGGGGGGGAGIYFAEPDPTSPLRPHHEKGFGGGAGGGGGYYGYGGGGGRGMLIIQIY